MSVVDCPVSHKSNSRRGSARAEDAQGTLSQSHISPSILAYEDCFMEMSVPDCPASHTPPPTFWGIRLSPEVPAGLNPHWLLPDGPPVGKRNLLDVD